MHLRNRCRRTTVADAPVSMCQSREGRLRQASKLDYIIGHHDSEHEHSVVMQHIHACVQWCSAVIMV